MQFGRGNFKLAEFEYLAATDDAVLLRIAGEWTRVPRQCDLVVATPKERITLEALPQVPSDDPAWRAAYSAPASVLGAQSRFQLVPERGGKVSLPAPVERAVGAPTPKSKPKAKPRPPHGLLARRRAARKLTRAGRAVGVDLRPALERERSAREAAERTAAMERAERERATSEMHEAVRRASGERERFLEWIEGNAEQTARLERALSEHHERLEQALTAERERAEHALEQERERAQVLVGEERERAERELAELRGELDQARAERAEACAEAEERLLAVRSAGRRMARLQTRIDQEVSARTRDIRASERRALDQVTALRGRVAELEDMVAKLVTGVEEGERRLAQAEELAQSLRAAIERAEAERPTATDLSGMRSALDRRLERLAHLERQAEALRTAIHERLATAADDPSQEQLFEAPVDDRTPVPV
jgi:hypothetical protein